MRLLLGGHRRAKSEVEELERGQEAGQDWPHSHPGGKGTAYHRSSEAFAGGLLNPNAQGRRGGSVA